MKKMIIAIVVIIMTIASATAQSDSVKLSGSLTFLTRTNSTFTGGQFSVNPALRLALTASYKDFSFTAMRNSDLLDPSTGGNLVALTPAYAKSYGKMNLLVAAELDLFDVTKEINLIAPYFVVGYNQASASVNVMGAYARLLQGGNIWVGSIIIGKSFQGYDFRVYGWAMDWNGPIFSLAGEISKQIAPHVKASVFYHLNDFTSQNHKEFGAVRVGYSF